MSARNSDSREWAIGVCVDEHDDHTRATTWLVGDERGLTGIGMERRNPEDRDVPAIGDELAVARALSDLAEQMLKVTAVDIEDVTHEQVRPLR